MDTHKLRGTLIQYIAGRINVWEKDMERLKENILTRSRISLECSTEERNLFAEYVNVADPDKWVSQELLVQDVRDKMPSLLSVYYQIAVRDIKSRYPIYNKSIDPADTALDAHRKLEIIRENKDDSTLGQADDTKTAEPSTKEIYNLYTEVGLYVLFIDITLYMRYVTGADISIKGLHYLKPESRAEQRFLVNKFKDHHRTKGLHRFFLFKTVQEAVKAERDCTVDLEYTKILDIDGEVPKRDGVFWVARQIEWIKQLEDPTMPPIRVAQSREWAHEVDLYIEKIRMCGVFDELAEPFDKAAEEILCQITKK